VMKLLFYQFIRRYNNKLNRKCGRLRLLFMRIVSIHVLQKVSHVTLYLQQAIKSNTLKPHSHLKIVSVHTEGVALRRVESKYDFRERRLDISVDARQVICIHRPNVDARTRDAMQRAVCERGLILNSTIAPIT